jgi:hypothetical protein
VEGVCLGVCAAVVAERLIFWAVHGTRTRRTAVAGRALCSAATAIFFIAVEVETELAALRLFVRAMEVARAVYAEFVATARVRAVSAVHGILRWVNAETIADQLGFGAGQHAASGFATLARRTDVVTATTVIGVPEQVHTAVVAALGFCRTDRGTFYLLASPTGRTKTQEHDQEQAIQEVSFYGRQGHVGKVRRVRSESHPRGLRGYGC